jgi:ubiquitin carboxyl-terminal hydrolase L3
MTFRKHFIPLESNPALFTALIHRLGVSTSLAFHDVLSIDNSDLLAFVPRPALALILVFPTSTVYEEHKSEEEVSRDDYSKNGDDEHVMWYRQTINNACGLYGILHAISNGDSRHFIREFSNPSKYQYVRPC